MDLLLLRSRTEPPALEDARLPGLARLPAALRLERPVRGSGSIRFSSVCSLRSLGSGSASSCGVVDCSTSLSISLPLPLPLVRDLRCALALGGLSVSGRIGGTSSSGSTSGRGLAGVPGVPLKLCRFQKLLADSGVPMALCGERDD